MENNFQYTQFDVRILLNLNPERILRKIRNVYLKYIIKMDQLPFIPLSNVMLCTRRNEDVSTQWSRINFTLHQISKILFFEPRNIILKGI